MPTKRGEETWLPEVIALAKFYECEPASLFPADVLCLEKSNFEKEMDASDLVMAIPGPSSSMSPEQLLQVEGRQKLLESTIREQLASISPREAQVLRLRFGLSESGSDQITQKEIGERLGVSQERIRQIEGQALRKLRHPSRAIPIARAAFEQYNDLGKDQP
jgi:DNA-binding CsgD family transcriptional regulator